MSPEEKLGDDECDDLLPRSSPTPENPGTTRGAYRSITVQLKHQHQHDQEPHQKKYDDRTTTMFAHHHNPPKSARPQYLSRSASFRRTITTAVLLFLVTTLLLLIPTQFFWRLRRPLLVNDTTTHPPGGGEGADTSSSGSSPRSSSSSTTVRLDYIVVGAGPAGIIVASRLAELRPDLQILLIEAGSTSQTDVVKQLWKQKLQQRQRAGIGSSSASSSSCLAADVTMMMGPFQHTAFSSMNEFDIPLFWSGAATSKEHHWPIELLGKAVGGSAIQNAMLYVRSLPSDWRNISGWNFTNIQDEYLALESYTGMGAGDAPDRTSGTNGPIRTSVPDRHDAIAPLFVRAAANAGYHHVSSFNSNGPRSNTVGFHEFNIRHGVRDSVAQAFLGNGIPDNLIIETDTTVTRVLLGLQHKKATGVEYVKGDTIGQYLVKKGGEVILSAGALLTPQLLHNSGFNFSYTVKDHPVVSVAFNVDSELVADEAQSSLYLVGHELNEYHAAVEQLSSMKNDEDDDVERNATDEEHWRRRLGALGTPGFTGGAFLRSPWADDTGAPDIQLTVFPQQMEPHVVRTGMKNGKKPAMLVTVALLEPDAEFLLHPSMSEHPLLSMSPKLKDTIVNSSTTTEEQRREWQRVLSYRLPKLGCASGSSETYLSVRDVNRLAWGIQTLRKIQQTEPLSLHTGPELYPATDDLRDYVRQHHLTNSHWVRSTPLGSAMVDERLRVAPFLRIVDAGVLPMVPNGNIHTTVCGLARRAATLILDDREYDASDDSTYRHYSEPATR